MRFFCVGFFFLSSAGLLGQDLKDFIVDPSYNGRIFLDVLMEIEKKHSVDFICDDTKMRALTVSGITERQRFTEFLKALSANYRLEKVAENLFFIIDAAVTRDNGLTKSNFIVLKDPLSPYVNLKGTVIDGVSKESLIGAKAYFPQFKTGSLTDLNGNFSFSNIPKGIVVLDLEYVGYEPNKYIIGFSKYAEATGINASLFSQSKELQSVTVTADRVDENVITPITGIEKLNIEVIKSLPTFLGEVDPIRSLTTLPGVTTTGELASGFNVRGGEAGQNLVLQEGALIYNPSHLFGFFSAFNPDLVSNVVLYKGSGPANLGGRISSVLDISLRNGNSTKHSVSGGLGLVSSRLTVEGPLVRNKSSYLIGGRLSYCNWLINSTDNISLKNSSADFRDLTAKIFHTINEDNIITGTFYNSYDDFSFATDSVFSWGTMNTSVTWDHTFNEKTFSSLRAFRSEYFSAVQSLDEIDAFTYRNSITNSGLRYDVTKQLLENVKFSGGVEATSTTVEPGKLTPEASTLNVEFQDMTDQHMLEAAAYMQGDFNLSERVSLNLGIRYSNFLRLGPGESFTYNYTVMDGRYPSITDTTMFSKNEIIQRFSGLEPRASIRFLVDNQTSIKASYYRGYQYMHLISNTTSTTPQDYWVGSGPYLKPQLGIQYSLGLFRNFKMNAYEFSVEGFYKDIQNAVDYIEGADITLNPILEAGLSQGKGLAYGIESMIKKKAGRTTGWVSYTYARSLRKFESGEGSIEINSGKYYASAFDQPHIMSVVLSHQLNKKTTLSANFNYSTGRPITIPISKFSYDVYLSVLNYSARNEYRIPDYHRLDLSLTIKGNPRKKFVGEWVISVFNVYGRRNTYSISFDRYGNASRLSILGTIFPSVTYGFKF